MSNRVVIDEPTTRSVKKRACSGHAMWRRCRAASVKSEMVVYFGSTLMSTGLAARRVCSFRVRRDGDVRLCEVGHAAQHAPQ